MAATPLLFTPANARVHVTPPSNLRRESLVVPSSGALHRIGKGSGVTVYRMMRSPGPSGQPRSPWVIKKADTSPFIPHELRRVEQTLRDESNLLARITHPNIVGFRAAQRDPDGQLCLALEACDCSLYSLVQERQFARIQYGEHDRSRPLFSPDEVLSVGCAVAGALAYLHTEHRTLHGDVKSANVLLSSEAFPAQRPSLVKLSSVKLCDLGVSLPLRPDLSGVLNPERNLYQGTEPWRPPECFRDACDEGGAASWAGEGPAEGWRVCDRSDVFALGLVLWEMLTGDVPHSSARSARGEDGYRAALGTRPALAWGGVPLATAHPEYASCVELFEWCTERDPADRPSASTLEHWLKLARQSGEMSVARTM